MELNKQEQLRLRKLINNLTLPKFEDGWYQYDYDWKQAPKQTWDWAKLNGVYFDTNNTPQIQLPTDTLQQNVSPVSGISDLARLSWAQSQMSGQDPDWNQLNTKTPARTTATVGNVGNAVTSTIAAVGDQIAAHNMDTTANDLAHQAGTVSRTTSGGIGWQQQQYADGQKFMDEVHSKNVGNTLKAAGSGAAAGAAIGSIIPGLGTVAGGIIGGVVGTIGGLFGSSSRSRKAREQLNKQYRQAYATNLFRESGAREEQMRLDNLKRGSLNPSLPGTWVGYKYGKMPVHSAYGLIDLPATARVSSGEIIVDGDTGEWSTVPGKKNNKDTMRAFVRGKDAVLTNKYGISDYVRMTGDVNGGLSALRYLMNYKNGKTPKYNEGALGNIIPSGLGMLAGVGLYIDAASQDIRIPNIPTQNPYEKRALSELYGLRINDLNIINRIAEAKDAANYNIDASGGLSSGQKAKFKLANTFGTQRNIANLLTNNQIQNNSYLANAANTALNAGTEYAKRMMQSTMFSEEMAAKAHAAKQQGKQMALYNILNQLQQYYANDFKRRQFNDTMNLYRQQYLLDADKFNAELNKWNNDASYNYYNNNSSKTNSNPIDLARLYTAGLLGAGPANLYYKQLLSNGIRR